MPKNSFIAYCMFFIYHSAKAYFEDPLKHLWLIYVFRKNVILDKCQVPKSPPTVVVVTYVDMTK